jgi:ketosteroid isomerase-like protein
VGNFAIGQSAGREPDDLALLRGELEEAAACGLDVTAPLNRLARAVSSHDIDALESCFAPGYRNETPAHPAQGFTGRDQVRRNWEQIFAFVPDITAQVLRHCCDQEMVWSEWEMSGIRRDGTTHQMAGVVLFGVSDGLFSWARFYLEPVQAVGYGPDAAVHQHVHADAVSADGSQP